MSDAAPGAGVPKRGRPRPLGAGLANEARFGRRANGTDRPADPPDASDELWRATRAIEVESGGTELLEAIVHQARRLGDAAHAEVRSISAAGEELRACTDAGAAHAGEERPCCADAAGAALRLPLRVGRAAVGELLVTGPTLAGCALRQVRRFAALAAVRLELERLREEVAQRALAESRSRFRAERFEDERSWLLSVIERSPVGILLVELEEKAEERITANRRAAELLGHPVDPARARQAIAGRLLAADGRPIPMEDLPSSRALRGERVTMQEGMLRRLDGGLIPIVVSAGPIVDAAGRQAGAVVR